MFSLCLTYSSSPHNISLVLLRICNNSSIMFFLHSPKSSPIQNCFIHFHSQSTTSFIFTFLLISNQKRKSEARCFPLFCFIICNIPLCIVIQNPQDYFHSYPQSSLISLMNFLQERNSKEERSEMFPFCLHTKLIKESHFFFHSFSFKSYHISPKLFIHMPNEFPSRKKYKERSEMFSSFAMFLIFLQSL